MYISSTFLNTDRAEIIAFMKQYNFATLITADDTGLPVATHLPFIVEERGEELVLISHFAKANKHWQGIELKTSLVVFAEPHAYISPRHYEKELNVPTWNYIAVHAYGKVRLLSSTEEHELLLEKSMDSFEPDYKKQWAGLPQEYKDKMIKGIVGFEMTITELQAKKKLSQNKTDAEQQKIAEALSKGSPQEQALAIHMKKPQ